MQEILNKLQDLNKRLDNSNILASQIAAATPPRVIPIMKEASHELLSEALQLVCRNANANLSLAMYKLMMTEAFRDRGITLWSRGDGIVTLKFKELQWEHKYRVTNSLVSSGVSTKDLDAYEWRFIASPTTLTLSHENMRTGLTPEFIARILRKTVRVAIQSNDCPVMVRYSVDKSGQKDGFAWIKSFSNTANQFPRYLGYEPVAVFNSVADLRDAGGIAPRVDRRYYYAAA